MWYEGWWLKDKTRKKSVEKREGQGQMAGPPARLGKGSPTKLKSTVREKLESVF